MNPNLTNPKNPWRKYEVADLLRAHSSIHAELRDRGILRTSNSPVADYAEWLSAKALRLTLANNSASGYDATDSRGRRYEIKAVRHNARGKAPQFSAFRNLGNRNFDLFVAVVFANDFAIERALVVPYKVVKATVGKYRKHTNSHVLLNGPRLWDAPGVMDITRKFRSAHKSPH